MVSFMVSSMMAMENTMKIKSGSPEKGWAKWSSQMETST